MFQGQDDWILGSMQESVNPEAKSVELLHRNVRMQEEHISLVTGSNDTSNSRDEISDCDDEAERELIKQIAILFG